MAVDGGGATLITGLVERIESAHSVWLFDTERHRFRRLPLGADADAPALDSDWEPYYSFDLDEATGAFTVGLNEDASAVLLLARLTVCVTLAEVLVL